MFTAVRGRLALGAVVVGAAIALSGCASSDPLASGPSPAPSSSGAKETLIVGSQGYYSNEIIAELYSQALEAGGFSIDRQYQIGQREVYLPELEASKIDVFPEYIGSLLQALKPDAAGGKPDAVFADLQSVTPEGLTVLPYAAASDQNSWTVTKAFADKYKLTDIASLKNVTEPITVGGNSELETRPYGPTALKDKYSVAIAGFTPVEDSGGPLTVKALVNNQIQLANIYTADPNIKSNDLVALEDPDGLFFPDNITTVVTDKVNEDARGIIEKVNAALSADDLVGLNAESANDKMSSQDIAKKWLSDKGLI